MGDYDCLVPATERLVAVVEQLAALAIEEKMESAKRRRNREGEEKELVAEINELRNELARVKMGALSIAHLVKLTLDGEANLAEVGDALRELRDRIRPELLERKLGDVIEAGITHCDEKNPTKEAAFDDS